MNDCPRGKERGGEQWEKWLTRVLHEMGNEGEQGTGAGDSQANFQARLKRLRESLSLLSAGADNPKWVHAKWKRQRNLRSAPTAPTPLSITLWYLPCSKVCQQSTRTSGRDNKQCAAVVPGKLPLQQQNFSMQATKIIAIKQREREKERRREWEKEKGMQLASWPHLLFSSGSLSQTQRLM